MPYRRRKRSKGFCHKLYCCEEKASRKYSFLQVYQPSKTNLDLGSTAPTIDRQKHTQPALNVCPSTITLYTMIFIKYSLFFRLIHKINLQTHRSHTFFEGFIQKNLMLWRFFSWMSNKKTNLQGMSHLRFAIFFSSIL